MTCDGTSIGAVRKRYNEITDIWDPADRWHEIVRGEVQGVVRRINRRHAANRRLVIDVGSGGLPQAVPHDFYVQVDIADARLVGQSAVICGDAHRLPIRDAVADCVLCVGSVANYCALQQLVAELSRIAAPNALMLLHLELTNSLEFLRRPMARAATAQVTTHYQGHAETTWSYSLDYTLGTLDQFGFAVEEQRWFHTLSALAYRSGIPARWASYLAVLDPLVRCFPATAVFADSVILTCRRCGTA